MAMLAIKQVVMRSPVNLRPALGIRPHTSAEALGFFGRGFLRRWRASGRSAHLEQARRCLAQMVASASRDWPGLSWGNQFDYVSRVFSLPAGEPTVVWTAHNGHALLDAWEATGDACYLEHARAVGRFVADVLPRQRHGHAECISYIPTAVHPVHNANVLGASFLARAAVATGSDAWRAIAQRAIQYTVERQRPDGSWWYGERRDLQWVDNFHTGYVLDSLYVYRLATGDRSIDAAIERGFDYYRRAFLHSDGRPLFLPGKPWPVDIQCAAQSIETLQRVGRQDPTAVEQAWRVADWTIRWMQGADGHFFARRHRWVTARVALLHWGQATMHSALAGLSATVDAMWGSRLRR
jgi:hypothetical protein